MSTEPRRLGKYELRERLGRGGQGVVWKAFDLELHRYVAVKELNADLRADPDFISRFEREARFIAALHHPNIVQIHDFQFAHTSHSNDSTAYMVMDYIEGPTLADYIRNTARKGQFPSASDLVSIFTAVSLALDYAHQKGMVHRDIKPANIMLDERNPHSKPTAILMDFGIAKPQGGFADTTKVLGTPLYVSPEQAQGQSGDKRSDLYSLGIVLYEVTTGVTPFRGESLMAILMQHYQAIPTPPTLINPNIPPELSAVILKSIAKDPDARFPSACAMTIALAETLKVPIPPELWRTSMTPTATSELNPLSLPAGMTPILSSSPVLSSPLPFTPSASSKQASSPAKVDDNPLALSPPPRKRLKKSLYIVPIILLVILGIGLVSYTFFFAPKSTSTLSSGTVVFLGSQNTPGVLDEAQITLQNIHDAPTGKSYYAWLVIHDDSIAPVHWSLTAHNGSLSSPSYINPQHVNLLTSVPYLFLITLQSGSTEVPSFNASERLYYAMLPQTKSATDNFSIVDHLNHLLTNDPNLEKLGLPYGLRYWLIHNTQALLQEAHSARDASNNKDIPTLRQHLVNIMYYLEGTSCAPSTLHNVPQGTPITPDAAVAHNTSVSLLNCTQNTILSGLLSHSETHVQGIAQAPGATHNQTALAPQIQTKITQVRASLEQLQQDVLQLVQLPDNQLLQASTQPLIEQMTTLADAAYSGHSQAGVQQIGDTLQQLATFDIMPCPQTSSNNICLM